MLEPCLLPLQALLGPPGAAAFPGLPGNPVRLFKTPALRPAFCWVVRTTENLIAKQRRRQRVSRLEGGSAAGMVGPGRGAEPGQDRNWAGQEPSLLWLIFSQSSALGCCGCFLASSLMGGRPDLTDHPMLRVLILPFKPQKEVWTLA